MVPDERSHAQALFRLVINLINVRNGFDVDEKSRLDEVVLHENGEGDPARDELGFSGVFPEERAGFLGRAGFDVLKLTNPGHHDLFRSGSLLGPVASPPHAIRPHSL